MIEIIGLSKNYGNNQVLTDIQLRLEAGKVYGIIGENGAGKTTLFRCVAGMEGYEGTVRSDKSPLKHHLGLLPTEPYFFPKITGKEYLRLLCNAREMSLPDIERKNIFDLPLDRYAATYSTGMKKKLALTAILLQENDYFILDEPFNGVDIQSNILITGIIHTLRELNKVVLISSHIFSTLTDTCDEIHLLQKGRFTRMVRKEDFSLLESEMKNVIIGDKLERLQLK